MLDARKCKILEIVTDAYIKTAQPVGSRTIAKKYNLGISPATIRNEMSDLEESGYLEQPHTSAGRIPSDKGYRFYVDSIMRVRKLSEAEERRIRQEYASRAVELESIIRTTARLLSQLSQQASIVVGPVRSKTIFRAIQLLPLDEAKVLAVIITDAGLVEHRIMEAPQNLKESDFVRISNIITARLRGMALSDLSTAILDSVEDEIGGADRFVREILERTVESLSSSPSERVWADGIKNIFGQPEFRDVERAMPVLKLLETEEQMLGILGNASDDEGVSVVIGTENPSSDLWSCSVITASYGIGDRTIGKIGIIGPTRIDYARVISLVETVASILSEALAGLRVKVD